MKNFETIWLGNTSFLVRKKENWAEFSIGVVLFFGFFVALWLVL